MTTKAKTEAKVEGAVEVKAEPKKRAKAAAGKVVPTAAGTDALDAVIAAGKETVAQAVKASAAATGGGYAQAAALNEEGFEALVQGYEEMAAFGKGNIEALMSAGSAAAKGFEAIGGQVMAFTKESVEGGLATTKAMMGAKTLQEMVALQADFAQASMQRFLETSSRLGEMSIKVGGEVSGPVNARLTEAVERLTRSKAA